MPGCIRSRTIRTNQLLSYSFLLTLLPSPGKFNHKSNTKTHREKDLSIVNFKQSFRRDVCDEKLSTSIIRKQIN